MTENYTENRPWGKFEILSQFKVAGGDVCVKIITVLPGKKLSYQSHKLRDEHWVFVQGQGAVILDDVHRHVVGGDRVEIMKGVKHRAINTGMEIDLVFVEVSTGHFDENDIERFEDDFGRA